MSFLCSGQEYSKPVVVRVKRKSWQSKLDAFWLEIIERPFKRPFFKSDELLTDPNCSNHEQVVESKIKKVFVQHVETFGSEEAAFDFVKSFTFDSVDVVKDKPETERQRQKDIKRESKQDELLSKGQKDQEVLAQNARFEQIWRSRRGNNDLHDKLHDTCHFYDVVRVHEENSTMLQEETTSMEDQRILNSYLPIPGKYIPSAIAEVESDIYSYLSEQGHEITRRLISDIESDIRAYFCEQDGYVYDYYTKKDEMDIGEQDAVSSLPVVQVGDNCDFFDGPDYESEYDSDDSNAEAHPRNDYPDQSSKESAASTDEEDENEEGVDNSDEEKEEDDEEEEEEGGGDGAIIRTREEEIDNASSVSSERDNLRHGLARDGNERNNGFYENGDENFYYMDMNEDLRTLDINEDLP